jgi:hypothetical protein
VGAAMLLAGMLTRLADDARAGEPAPGG